jgi:hypothetical protein
MTGSAPTRRVPAKREHIEITSIPNLQCLHRESSGRRSQEGSPWAPAGFVLLKMVFEQTTAKRRSSMSLKFAALGGLTFRRPLETLARTDDQAQNLGSVEPQEALLITFGWRSSIAKSKKLEPGVMKRFLIKARQAFVIR